MILADKFELEFDTPANLPNLGFYKVGLHLTQVFFGFLTMCLTASVISTERTYYSSSQGAPNYTLVVTLSSLFVSVALAMFPWPRFNNGVYPTIRAFFLRPRTSLIFTCFFSLTWFIAMISMTVHSTNESNCNLDGALIEKHSGYANDWKNQCNCAKTVVAFSWFLFFAWLGTAVCSAILLWHEKKQRHLEKNANQQDKDQESHTVTSTTEYNEDAQTIFNEKDKESYRSGSPFSNRTEQDKQMSKAHSPAMIETPFITDSYSSPLAEVNTATYSPLIHEPTPPYNGVHNSVSTITARFTPNNLMSPQQVPQTGFGPSQYPASINDTVSSYLYSPPYTSSPCHTYPSHQPYYPSHSSLPMDHQAFMVQQPENYATVNKLY